MKEKSLQADDEEKFRMQPPENEHESGDQSDMIDVPRTKLTETMQKLQNMFPNVNTAIIDRVVVTSKGDLKISTDKLFQISSKFS